MRPRARKGAHDRRPEQPGQRGRAAIDRYLEKVVRRRSASWPVPGPGSEECRFGLVGKVDGLGARHRRPQSTASSVRRPSNDAPPDGAGPDTSWLPQRSSHVIDANAGRASDARRSDPRCRTGARLSSSLAVAACLPTSSSPSATARTVPSAVACTVSRNAEEMSSSCSYASCSKPCTSS